MVVVVCIFSLVLYLGNRKYAIEVASTNDVVPTLQIIKTAVEAGELDVAIENASLKLREGFAK